MFSTPFHESDAAKKVSSRCRRCCVCHVHPWSVLRTLCLAPPFVRANTTPAKAAEGAAILLGGGVYSTPVPLISCPFSSVATKSVIDAIVAWRSRRRWRRAIGGRARDDGVVAGRENVVSHPVAMRTSRADGLDGLVGGNSSSPLCEAFFGDAALPRAL